MIVCPKCGSSNIKREYSLLKAGLITFLIGIVVTANLYLTSTFQNWLDQILSIVGPIVALLGIIAVIYYVINKKRLGSTWNWKCKTCNSEFTTQSL